MLTGNGDHTCPGQPCEQRPAERRVWTRERWHAAALRSATGTRGAALAPLWQHFPVTGEVFTLPATADERAHSRAVDTPSCHQNGPQGNTRQSVLAPFWRVF